MVSGEHPHVIIEDVIREEWGRVLSVLVGQIRDFELAEDSLQDALIVALEQWGEAATGIPEDPSAWLLKVARRKMIDQVRRRENIRRKQDEIVAAIESNFQLPPDPSGADEEFAIPDERLRLIFTCCHPALSEEARVGLTLQTLGGLKTPEIAKSFLIPEATMAQRLVRAKRKIKVARIPYEIPEAEDLPERLSSVLATIYLIFNEGYSASSGDDSVRSDLCEEAIRLGRILVTVAPEHAEAKGLLALMLLHHSRSAARIDSDGNLIILEDQDRGLWNRELIGQGVIILEEGLAHQTPGPYQLQAAISALHAEAANHASTDWQQIYLLYQALLRLQPDPVVRLNALVSLSYAGGPDAALDALAEIRDEPQLQNYLPFHATEADFLRRVGKGKEAVAAYQRALELAGNAPERAFLEGRLREVEEG